MVGYRFGEFVLTRSKLRYEGYGFPTRLKPLFAPPELVSHEFSGTPVFNALPVNVTVPVD